MPEIFVRPDEVAVPLVEGETLLEMAVEAGLPIAHLCGGRARCSTCRIRVIEGLDALGDRTEAEAAMAERLDFPDEVRSGLPNTCKRGRSVLAADPRQGGRRNGLPAGQRPLCRPGRPRG